jgi:hypothetical protein
VTTEVSINLSLVNAKAPLRALADVSLKFDGNEVILRRCAVFRKDGAPPWANLPSFPLEKNGKRTYVVLIELPGELKKRVLAALLEEYQKKSDDL